MRLAIVSLMAGQQWGGSEMLWHALAKYALQQGDTVFVSVYNWGTEHEKVKELREAGAKIRYRKLYNADADFIEKILRFVKNRKPVLNRDYQTIINFKPNHVFISQGDNFDLAMHHRPLYTLLTRNSVRYSFVCHSHAQYSAIPPASIYDNAAEVFQNARGVYFVSERQRSLTERKLLTSLSNAHFTWNPLALTIPEVPYSWPKGETMQFALVGAAVGGKGHDTIMQVLSEPRWQLRKWRLNLYGGGEGEDYLKKLAIFYGLQNNITFHGHVNDIPAIWQLNQLLLIPSATEGMPISLIEAMACGRPCVVADVGGVTEIVTDGLNGFVAPAPSVKHFSEAMETAIQHKDSLSQLGIAAFEKIQRSYEKNPETRIYWNLSKG